MVSTFTTGPQRVAVVDDKTKTMNVYSDGQLVHTAPVSLGGGEDWLSPTGYAVIMEQERHSNFNAGTIGLKPGDKGYYPPLVVNMPTGSRGLVCTFTRPLKPHGVPSGGWLTSRMAVWACCRRMLSGSSTT